MPFPQEFLTPRGLLVNKSFVCEGTSFSKLITAINNMLLVPYTKEQILARFGFSGDGYEILDEVKSCIQYMEKIHVEADKLKIGYHDVATICDTILVLSAAAPNDYNDIFADLKRLYEEEADNEELRKAVKAKIDARLAGIRTLSTKASATRKVLADSTQNVGDAQASLKQIGQQFNTGAMYERLISAFIPDFVAIAVNKMAMDLIRGWLSQLELTDETRSALTELQKAVGAVAEIDMDLADLREYVEENTSPGPDPILDIQKGNILEKWEDLDKEVRKFKANFIDTAQGVKGFVAS